MTEEEFRGELMHAMFQRNHTPDLVVAYYWLGYEWGVCCRFYDPNFGTAAQQRVALAAGR